MALIRWNPWRGFNDAYIPRFRDFEEECGCEWTPKTNIYENDKQVLLTVELPGMSKEKVNISVDDRVLTISGNRVLQANENGRYNSVESDYGKFSRSFSLGPRVNSENIEAHFENGILTVTLPKIEEAKPKQIEINGN